MLMNRNYLEHIMIHIEKEEKEEKEDKRREKTEANAMIIKIS